MKKQLLTLEKVVSLIDSRLQGRYSEGTYDMSKELQKGLDEIVKAKDLLQTTLTVGQFIAAKDGKPMEKPEEFTSPCHEGQQEMCGQELLPCECAALYNQQQAYQAAEKAVIFKGWEIEYNDTYDSGINCIGISNGMINLEFIKGSYSTEIECYNGSESTPIKNLSHLASETQDNPIELV